MRSLRWPAITFAQMEPDAAVVWPLLHSANEDALGFSGDGLQEEVFHYYDQLRDPVYRYLLTLRMTQETAEDLVHETFLKLHRALVEKKVRTDSVRAWTFRVAHNLAISLKRKASELSLDINELISLSDVQKVDSSPNPEETALMEEWLLRVRNTVLSLPASQQRCIHLRAEGLRYREIAEVLGIPTSTVANQLQRAIARVLEECGE